MSSSQRTSKATSGTNQARINRLEELLSLAVALLAEERGIALDQLRAQVFAPSVPVVEPPSDMGVQIIRLAQLKRKLAVGHSSIYRWMENDGFPKPIKLGRATGWIESEVEAWMRARLEARTR
jgi:prophage regulatory protein